METWELATALDIVESSDVPDSLKETVDEYADSLDGESYLLGKRATALAASLAYLYGLYSTRWTQEQISREFGVSAGVIRDHWSTLSELAETPGSEPNANVNGQFGPDGRP